VLLVGENASGESRERLAVLVRTNDGFAISEEDLKRRGPGDVLGKRQSGMPLFRVGDMVRDVQLMKRAQEEAANLVRVGCEGPFRERLFLREDALPQAD